MNWPTDARSARAFRVAVAAVLLAHAAALWQMAASHPSLTQERPPGTSIVLARLLDVHENSGAAEKPPRFVALDRSSEVAAEPRRPAPPAAIAEQSPPSLDRPSSSLAPTTVEEGVDAFLDYLPRSRLTAKPTALTDVQIPFPEHVTGTVDLRVVASLYIDELGKVRRVRLDSPAVPSAFAQVIVDTFLATRFAPGEVNTVPVRSRVRVEIEFRAGAPSR